MNMVCDKTALPADAVKLILEFIQKKYDDEKLMTEFPNPILRDDVLFLLDKYCTVVYYPLEGENNNGFHVMGIPDKNGNEQHFVFINTAQTIEKQVFTAAHELGHIWRVDEYVARECDITLQEESREQIINRFAAELLIPKQPFSDAYHSEFQKYKNAEGKITLVNLLRVVVALMNQFFVPMKSIVLRCYELELLSPSAADLLLGNGDIAKDAIDAKVEELIRDNGYTRFQEPTMKKWIDHLSDLLDRAEKTGTVSKSKIDNLRKTFSIKKETEQTDMNKIVS